MSIYDGKQITIFDRVLFVLVMMKVLGTVENNRHPIFILISDYSFMSAYHECLDVAISLQLASGILENPAFSLGILSNFFYLGICFIFGKV